MVCKITLEVELEDGGVATNVEEDEGRSDAAVEADGSPGWSCKERRPPSSFSPKIMHVLSTLQLTADW